MCVSVGGGGGGKMLEGVPVDSIILRMYMYQWNNYFGGHSNFTLRRYMSHDAEGTRQRFMCPLPKVKIK